MGYLLDNLEGGVLKGDQLSSPILYPQSPPKESIHLRERQVLKIEGG